MRNTRGSGQRRTSALGARPARTKRTSGGWTGRSGTSRSRPLPSALRTGLSVAPWPRSRTSRKRTHLERRIEQERAQLLTLIDNLPDGVFLKDETCRFIRANKVVADIMHAGRPENLIGKTDHDFYPKEMADQFLADERAIIATGRKLVDKEEPKVVSGSLRLIATTKVPVLDARGAVQGLVGISRDTTKQREAEAALSASERRYQTIVENITDGLIIHDFQGNILDVNENACRMLGRTRAELVGRNLASVDNDESRKEIPRKIQAMIQSGSSLFEAIQLRKDGSEVPVEVSTKVVSREGAGVIHAFVRDLTERKKALEDQRKLREQLQEAQKMEAVGRLAGGIAHDFNNLLTVINGYCEMALDRVPGNQPLHADLTEIKRATRRAATLTTQLLAFSRRQILQPRILDLGALVAGVTEMITRLLGEDIKVRARRSSELWGVRADPGKIEQVVVNLAVNSRDAMPQGGVLSMETSNVSLSEDFPSEHPEVPRGEYVLLSVIDTGVGMDQATLDRIFEPFFTTKEKGKGTGWALQPSTALSSRVTASSPAPASPARARPSGCISHAPRAEGRNRRKVIRAPRRPLEALKPSSWWKMTRRCGKSPCPSWSREDTRSWRQRAERML